MAGSWCRVLVLLCSTLLSQNVVAHNIANTNRTQSWSWPSGSSTQRWRTSEWHMSPVYTTAIVTSFVSKPLSTTVSTTTAMFTANTTLCEQTITSTVTSTLTGSVTKLKTSTILSTSTVVSTATITLTSTTTLPVPACPTSVTSGSAGIATSVISTTAAATFDAEMHGSWTTCTESWRSWPVQIKTSTTIVKITSGVTTRMRTVSTTLTPASNTAYTNTTITRRVPATTQMIFTTLVVATYTSTVTSTTVAAATFTPPCISEFWLQVADGPFCGRYGVIAAYVEPGYNDIVDYYLTLSATDDPCNASAFTIDSSMYLDTTIDSEFVTAFQFEDPSYLSNGDILYFVPPGYINDYVTQPTCKLSWPELELSCMNSYDRDFFKFCYKTDPELYYAVPNYLSLSNGVDDYCNGTEVTMVAVPVWSP